MKLCPNCEEAYPDDAGFCPFDGEALARSVDPLLGRTMAARYRLVRKLGSGGMAVVYLARHMMIERQNAIKILRRDLGINPAHRERFLREARAVNRINHPNIVEITDFGEDAGLVFLVMEYIEGASLASLIRHNALPWRRSANVALQVASALGRAHELGVIHRDLKPENVLLCVRNGVDVVKLTDFGIAKIVDAPALTFSEQRFGTPGYMAPEYIEGEASTGRGDLYALGVLLYELLTAQMPFDARFPAELFARQLSESPIRPSARVDGIPLALEALILQLMDRRPDKRPRDAFEVHDSLRNILAQGTVGAASQAGDSVSPEQPHRSYRTKAASALRARWEASLAAFQDQIDEARRTRGEADPRARRADELGRLARNLLASLERAANAVGDEQAAVDSLEAQGREFRARLGHAIDTLSRDRSREVARLDGLARRRVAIHEESIAEAETAQRQDALAWELAAVTAEESRERTADVDLGFQIQALQRQLDEHNELLDSRLMMATAKLEGALSAVRRITREMTRTREEAARALSA